MLRTEKREIKGYTYAVTSLGSKVGGRLLVRIGKSLGQALALAVVRGGKAGVAAVIAAIPGSITEEDFDHLVNTFAPETRVSGGEGEMRMVKPLKLTDVFESHFSADYMAMVQWLGFCLEVNYKSFFLELIEAMSKDATEKSEDSPVEESSE